MAPLVVRDHLLVGVSGDFDNLPGILKSIDPESGKTQWTFYSTPPAGAADSTSGGATGGQMWMTGTYDPELNLVFVGTGNPTPTLNGPARPGDNPWTCSILAINPDSGHLAWGFQASPHDTHDWDAAEVPVLVDAMFDGAPRKLLLQASRNGYFFVLDRTNGKSLLTKPFAAVNWASGVDGDGRPTPSPAKEPARDGRLVAPNESGATNFRVAKLRSANGFARRQRAGWLRHLLFQAGARRVRMGGRRLHALRQERDSRDRLSHRRDQMEPRDRRRCRHGRSVDDGVGADVHR